MQIIRDIADIKYAKVAKYFLEKKTKGSIASDGYQKCKLSDSLKRNISEQLQLFWRN